MLRVAAPGLRACPAGTPTGTPTGGRSPGAEQASPSPAWLPAQGQGDGTTARPAWKPERGSSRLQLVREDGGGWCVFSETAVGEAFGPCWKASSRAQRGGTGLAAPPAASPTAASLSREERLFRPGVPVIFCLLVISWGPRQLDVCDLAVVSPCDGCGPRATKPTT